MNSKAIFYTVLLVVFVCGVGTGVFVGTQPRQTAKNEPQVNVSIPPQVNVSIPPQVNVSIPPQVTYETVVTVTVPVPAPVKTAATPKPTLTPDPAKYVPVNMGYEDSGSSSHYIGNSGNFASMVYQHETSLIVNTAPKKPTFNTVMSNKLATGYNDISDPVDPDWVGKVGPDGAGLSVYADMTKDELAALLNKCGAIYDSKGMIVQYGTGSHVEQDTWAKYLGEINHAG